MPLGVFYLGEVISISVTICGYRFPEKKNLAELDMAGV